METNLVVNALFLLLCVSLNLLLGAQIVLLIFISSEKDTSDVSTRFKDDSRSRFCSSIDEAFIEAEQFVKSELAAKLV